jgi:hypothetical protein
MQEESEVAAASKRKRLHFLEGKHVFINIDRAIVDKLHLTENDSFIEEVTTDGILLRRQAEFEA